MTSRYCLIVACTFAMANLLAGCDQRSAFDTPQSSSPTRSPGKKPFEMNGPPAISLTEKAAAAISTIIAEQGRTGKCVLRVRVVPGGCQGFMHKLDLDPSTSSEDYLCESRRIKVALFKRQIDMLRGAEIDFVRESGKEGFKVENPNFKGEWAKKWLALLEKETDVK